jgi:hypothetical protein
LQLGDARGNRPIARLPARLIREVAPITGQKINIETFQANALVC